jgi:hypothetical protein
MPPTLEVRLTYFKKNGKYYESGAFTVDAIRSLLDIWQAVQEMRSDGFLPGLCEGAGREFIILINVPGHEHEHPHLLMP